MSNGQKIGNVLQDYEIPLGKNPNSTAGELTQRFWDTILGIQVTLTISSSHSKNENFNKSHIFHSYCL